MKEASTFPQVPAGAKARATYERVLEAAEQVLEAAGYAGATTTAIAAAAGVATGTVYRYFPDKDAVLGALFARRIDDLMASVEALLVADHLLDQGLRAAMSTVVDTVAEAYQTHAAVFRVALSRVSEDPSIRALYWERHARSVEAVQRFLRRGARAGLTRHDQAGAVATTFVVVTQGLNHPALRSLSSANGILIEAVREEFATILERLLAPHDLRGNREAVGLP